MLPQNNEEITKALSSFLTNELTKAKAKHLILGLSGGIDSAVVCALSALAIGPKNVYTICLPYKTSNPNSEAHARLLAIQLGVNYEVIEITPMIDAYFNGVDTQASALRRGNKMARERMTILYDHSAKYHGLVVGTSNKTEILLGYGTLYGDTVCAINPIGDLYKTQIFALAKYLKIPAEIINKVPSADLWHGQADEDELGFKYKDIDQLLFAMREQQLNKEQLIKQGFSEEFINRVLHLNRRAHFKRRLPLIATLSSNPLNFDLDL